MNGRACGRCEWWLQIEGSAEGGCRGGPPTLNQYDRAQWPLTDFRDWCGAFRLREAECGGQDARSTGTPSGAGRRK